MRADTNTCEFMPKCAYLYRGSKRGLYNYGICLKYAEQKALIRMYVCKCSVVRKAKKRHCTVIVGLSVMLHCRALIILHAYLLDFLLLLLLLLSHYQASLSVLSSIDFVGIFFR